MHWLGCIDRRLCATLQLRVLQQRSCDCVCYNKDEKQLRVRVGSLGTVLLGVVLVCGGQQAGQAAAVLPAAGVQCTDRGGACAEGGVDRKARLCP